MSTRGQHPILPLVFLCGAAVLAIEVAATRLLAPSFGTTVFAVSSVISVVLGALSLGYWVGGRLADRSARPEWFYLLVYAGGLSVLLIEPGLDWFVPFISRHFNLMTGPLVASLSLFFIPSFLLGSLSPFAVVLYRQQTAGRMGVGQAAGSVSFWSTLGSIAGSLSAAFVFIPLVGLSLIILGLGVLLGATGWAGLVFSQWPRRYLAWTAAGALAVFSLAYGVHLSHRSQALYERDGRYAHISVFDQASPRGTVRYLQLDGSHSAAKLLGSDELVYRYTRFAELLPVWRPQSQRALVIGGGAYSIPQALVQKLPAAQVDVAEIEPDLYGLSQRYFGVSPNPRLHNYVEDGRRILQGKTSYYDLIFGDAYYSVSSIPQHLATREFFETARTALTDGGVFMANVIGRLDDQPQSFTLSEIRTFQTAFPESLVVAVNSPADTAVQNLVFIGFKGPKPDLAALPGTVDLTRYNLTSHRIFTDDFAPIDYYIATSVSLGS